MICDKSAPSPLRKLHAIGSALAILGVSSSAAIEVPQAAVWHLKAFVFETDPYPAGFSMEEEEGTATLTEKVPGSVYTLTFDLEGEEESFDLTVQGDLLVGSSEDGDGAFTDYWRLTLRIVDENTLVFTDVWATMTSSADSTPVYFDCAGGLLTRAPLPVSPAVEWEGNYKTLGYVESGVDTGEPGIWYYGEAGGDVAITKKEDGSYLAVIEADDEDDELELSLVDGRLEFSEDDTEPHVLHEDGAWRFENVLFSDRAVALPLGNGRIFAMQSGSEITKRIQKSNGSTWNYINWADLFVWVLEKEGAEEPEGFASWVEERFTGEEAAAPEISGPEADPDKDGIPNLLEYAFNLDPKVSGRQVVEAGTGTSGLPAVTLEEAEEGDDEKPRLRIEFLRRRNSQLSYIPEFTSDLSSPSAWEAAGGVPEVTPVDDDDEWERVIVKDEIPAAGPASKRFARVRVELP